MSLTHHFHIMSRYNQRMNQQLLRCCGQLPSEVLQQETHSFFPNIISYWNHIIFADLLMLKRLADNNIANFSLKRFDGLPVPQTPNDIYHNNLNDIEVLRVKIDEMITDLLTNITEDEFTKTMHYKTTEGDIVNQQVSVVCAHLFNHQTHHRGQLTTILSQLDVDFGCTDLPVIVAIQ